MKSLKVDSSFIWASGVPAFVLLTAGKAFGLTTQMASFWGIVVMYAVISGVMRHFILDSAADRSADKVSFSIHASILMAFVALGVLALFLILNGVH